MEKELKSLASSLKKLGLKKESNKIIHMNKFAGKKIALAENIKISSGMAYHIENNIPISEPIYRENSFAYFDLMKEAKSLYEKGILYVPEENEWMFDGELGSFAEYDGWIVPLRSPMSIDNEEMILRLAAEYQGKKVKLRSPRPLRKGEPGYGRKQNVVYVKDGDKVKRITFGDPNLKAKPEKKKNRESFRARHKCDQKKDDTKPGYWACRYPPNW